jgi:hypothetical protein
MRGREEGKRGGEERRGREEGKRGHEGGKGKEGRECGVCQFKPV